MKMLKIQEVEPFLKSMGYCGWKKIQGIWQLIIYTMILLILLCAMIGCENKNTSSAENELVIFHAGSLSVPLREISALFQKEHPDIIVKPEASGNRDAARKICELGRRCDVFASADYKVVTDYGLGRSNLCYAGQ